MLPPKPPPIPFIMFIYPPIPPPMAPHSSHARTPINYTFYSNRQFKQQRNAYYFFTFATYHQTCWMRPSALTHLSPTTAVEEVDGEQRDRMRMPWSPTA